MIKKTTSLKKQDTNQKRLLQKKPIQCRLLDLNNSQTLNNGDELKIIDYNSGLTIFLKEKNISNLSEVRFFINNINDGITPKEYAQKLIFDLKKIDTIINDSKFKSQAPKIATNLVKRVCKETSIVIGQGLKGQYSPSKKRITYAPFESRVNWRNNVDDTVSYNAPDVTLFHEAIHFFNFQREVPEPFLNASRANLTNKEEEQTIYYENIYRTLRGFENRTAHADGTSLFIQITPSNGTCTEPEYLSPFNNSDNIMNVSVRIFRPQEDFTHEFITKQMFLLLTLIPFAGGEYYYKKRSEFIRINRFLDDPIPSSDGARLNRLNEIENISKNKKLPERIRKKALSKLPEDRRQTIIQSNV